MDSVTQFVLGAAVGEATLGRKLGNRAPLLGGVVATLPDLDVLVGAGLSEVAQLTFHRGYSHSLLFLALLAPLLGYLLYRLHRDRGVSWRQWSWFCFLVLSTAVLLDAFTSYGVQLFLPFSDHSLALATISVIDPLYTLPLLIGLLVILVLRRDSALRRRVNLAALGLSSVYLAVTVGNKLAMHQVFAQQLAAQDIPAERHFVKPTAFNNLLWRGIAETEDAYWVGFRSLLDGREPIRFQRFAKNHHLVDDLRQEEALRRLIWVSKGYYQVQEIDGERYFNDLRFGTAFEWLEDERDFVFSYRLVEPVEAGGRVEIERVALSLAREHQRGTLPALIARIHGK